MRSNTRIILAAVAGALLAVLIASHFVVEGLWVAALGYIDVFWRLRLTQAVLFVAAFVVAFAGFIGNAAALRRLAAAVGGPWPTSSRAALAWSAVPAGLAAGEAHVQRDAPWLAR